MSENFEPGAAAGLLAEAWRSGALLAELPVAVRPTTIAQGYDIQDRLIAELGQPISGWKLGVGSHIQKKQSGIGRAIAGRILASHLHQNGATIQLPNAAPVTMEFEIAYVLGRDILPDEPAFPLTEIIQETRVSLELVLARFIDRRAVGWPSFTADNAGFHALVIGETVDPGDLAQLVEELVVLTDGKEAARSLQGEDATDPMAALGDLVAIARERNMVLPKGSIISTGTVSKPFNVALPSAEITAKFLGRQLSCHISRVTDPGAV